MESRRVVAGFLVAGDDGAVPTLRPIGNDGQGGFNRSAENHPHVYLPLRLVSR